MTPDRIGFLWVTWFGCRIARTRRTRMDYPSRRHAVEFDVITMPPCGQRCKDPAPFEPGGEEQA